MNLELCFCPDPTSLAETAAQRWIEMLARRDRDVPYGVALPGGRLAAAFFDSISLLTKPKFFENIHFFWADERCVPPQDPESNYCIAKARLFDTLSINAENIHRILGEVEDDYAVKQAEAEICRILPMTPTGQPVLDIVFLGMGEDGHTASLFPGEASSMVEETQIYRAVIAPKPPPRRITLGYQTLIAAREAWILASGEAKKSAFLETIGGLADLPIARVIRHRTKTLYFNDIAPGM